jgi:hypothetical protein
MGTGYREEQAARRFHLLSHTQGIRLVHVTGQRVEIATRHHDGVGSSGGAYND